MGEERLSGLATIFIHNTVKIDIDQVLEIFKEKKRRRLDF